MSWVLSTGLFVVGRKSNKSPLTWYKLTKNSVQGRRDIYLCEVRKL